MKRKIIGWTLVVLSMVPIVALVVLAHGWYVALVSIGSIAVITATLVAGVSILDE